MNGLGKKSVIPALMQRSISPATFPALTAIIGIFSYPANKRMFQYNQIITPTPRVISDKHKEKFFVIEVK